MSERHILHKGQSVAFTTRPFDQRTKLSILPTPPDPDYSFHVVWHKELCCEPDHSVRSAGEVDISAAGALVTVRNVGADAEMSVVVWTDYA